MAPTLSVVNVEVYQMDTTKLREALVEMQAQRNVLDSAIASIQNALTMLDGAPAKTFPVEADVKRSYIDDVVAMLEREGKPMHMRAIMNRLNEMRGTESSRASVEASIVRHVGKATHPKLARFGTGTFGLAQWKQPTLAQTA